MRGRLLGQISTPFDCLLLGVGVTYSLFAAATPLLEPGLHLSQAWTSNSLLSPHNEAQSDWITEIKPNVKVSTDSVSTNFINYQLQALHYVHKTKSPHIFQQGQFKGSYAIPPKRVNLTVLGAYTQQILDPSLQYSFDNRIGSRLPDVFITSLIPSYAYEKGASLTQLSLNQSYTQFFHTSQPDTIDAQWKATHRKKRKVGPSSYEFTTSWRQTKVGNGREISKKDIEASFSLPVHQSIWFLQKVGYEDIIEETDFLHREVGYRAQLGFEYVPTNYFQWIFLIGRAPHGKQYETILSFHTTLTELQLSVSESVHNTIQTQIDALPNTVNSVMMPNTLRLQLPFVNDIVTSQNSNLFIKRTAGSAVFSMNLAHTEETTLHTQQTAKASGLAGSLGWQFRPRQSLQCTGSWQKQHLLAEIQQIQWSAVTAYHYQIMPKQNMTVQLQHFNRKLTDDFSIQENQLGVGYSVVF